MGDGPATALKPLSSQDTGCSAHLDLPDALALEVESCSGKLGQVIQPGCLLAHFYHAWAAGDWERPAEAHANAMRAAGLIPDYLLVGLVGSSTERGRAAGWFRDQELAKVTEFTEASTGFEQVTLRTMRDWARTGTDNAAVLYAHTKGAYNISAVTVAHREIMTGAVVGRWREAVRLLDDHDAAGCFWEPVTTDGSHGCFIGNFWWVTRAYLAQLPELDTSSRFPAETWIGRKAPEVYNLRPDITYADMAEAALGKPEQEHLGTAAPAGASGWLPPPGTLVNYRPEINAGPSVSFMPRY